MDSFILTVFGFTSNLARIKLIPALYDLAKSELLPDKFSVVGIARSPKSKQEIAAYVKEVLHERNRHHDHPIDDSIVEKLCKRIHYVNGNIKSALLYKDLLKKFDELAQEGNNCDNRMFYLATYPELYSNILEKLEESKLNKGECGWVRILLEKPIGTDLQSAKTQNALLAQYFTEDQIFRLDHYLGKETLQNILAFRFANEVMEPLMTSKFVDHIQITAAEEFGIGARGGYYDTVGALKDVGQNHLLQMAAFVTMSKPSSWTNQSITQARIELLKNLTPSLDSIVFGQYEGYTKEKNINPHSSTDTFFAFKTTLTNDSFTDLPIYYRGGKMLHQTVTEISVVFKTPNDRLFKNAPIGMTPNALIYRIQPNEGIVLKILTKKPQHKLELEETYMQYCYKDYSIQLPDPYERLIHDALLGDQTFFVDAPEVEEQWRITDPLSAKREKPIIYKRGSWGPKEANDMITQDGREWLHPSLAFCRN